MKRAPRPKFFATPDAFRTWLEKHHASSDELLVGFHRTSSGRKSMTWSESVDQALCFGWIDGVRKSIDAESYTIRFTLRRPTSIWSKVNVRKIGELTAAGLTRPAGLAAFARHTEARTGVYSAEQKDVRLGEADERAFRAKRRAWTFFEKQPMWYRRAVTWWVISAKRAETRERRLATLIADSNAGEWVGPVRAARKKGAKKAAKGR